MIRRWAAAAVAGWLLWPIAVVPATAAMGSPGTPTPTPGGQSTPAQSGTRKAVDRGPTRLRPSQFAAVIAPRQLTGTSRPQIILRPGRVELMVGANVLWTGYLSSVGVGVRTAPNLSDIARLVARTPHKDWLVQQRAGVFLLRAALVQAPGTSLRIAAPQVRELRMLSGKQVYLSGVSATVDFTGVTVTSWRARGGGDPVATIRRPFISYDKAGSSLRATKTRFTYLGSDGILAYGVTWGRGATGSAIGCTFDHNFFGAYTNQAVGVTFRRNVFRDNDLYGLDPHTNSSKLVVDNNDAYRNGMHGIILSEDVVDSSITGNRSYDNDGNGIMLDDRSDRNVVTGNRTWDNAGDGIVLQNSSDTLISENTVTGNRLGIRVNGVSLSNRVTDNQLAGNERGIEVYSGPSPAKAISRPNVFTKNSLDGGGKADGITVKNFAGVQIIDNAITHYLNGIVISGASRQVGITANTLTDVQRGIDIGSAAIGARMSRNFITGAAERGIILSGLNSLSQHDTVVGSDIGIDIRNTASVQNASVTGGRRGFNLVAGAASVTDAKVIAEDIGFSVDPGVTLDLRQSEVQARYPVTGATVPAAAGNELITPPPPFQWLAAAGALFIIIAVILYMVYRARSPMKATPTESVPRGVRNAW